MGDFLQFVLQAEANIIPATCNPSVLSVSSVGLGVNLQDCCCLLQVIFVGDAANGSNCHLFAPGLASDTCLTMGELVWGDPPRAGGGLR